MDEELSFPTSRPGATALGEPVLSDVLQLVGGSCHVCARVLALGLLLTGCEPDPWQTFPLSVEPNQQCRTGHEQGYDVYVWHCHQGQRVAIFRRCSALLGCAPTERQSVSCGSTTPIERQLKLTDHCETVPTTMRWVARKPEGL